jgi:hypothetical protein
VEHHRCNECVNNVVLSQTARAVYVVQSDDRIQRCSAPPQTIGLAVMPGNYITGSHLVTVRAERRPTRNQTSLDVVNYNALDNTAIHHRHNCIHIYAIHARIQTTVGKLSSVKALDQKSTHEFEKQHCFFAALDLFVRHVT